MPEMPVPTTATRNRLVKINARLPGPFRRQMTYAGYLSLDQVIQSAGFGVLAGMWMVLPATHGTFGVLPPRDLLAGLVPTRRPVRTRSSFMTSDLTQPEALIAAVAANGDRSAFAALFSHYAPRLKGMLMRAGETADVAEDLAQEAMASVWRKAAQFDPARASVGTWIFSIARNLRIDRARRGRGVTAETVYEVLKGDDPDRPDDMLLGHERDQRVRDALRALPTDQLTVVRLSFFEDKPHGEIAALLNLPLGTVKSRLRLAMSKLRDRLQDGP